MKTLRHIFSVAMNVHAVSADTNSSAHINCLYEFSFFNASISHTLSCVGYTMESNWKQKWENLSQQLISTRGACCSSITTIAHTAAAAVHATLAAAAPPPVWFVVAVVCVVSHFRVSRPVSVFSSVRPPIAHTHFFYHHPNHTFDGKFRQIDKIAARAIAVTCVLSKKKPKLCANF